MSIEMLIKKSLVHLYNFNRRRTFRKKSAKLLPITGKETPPEDTVKRYRKLWGKLNVKPDTAWLKIYGNVSGLWDHRYVPEPLYYTILEPALNNKAFSKAWTDKNVYRQLLKGFTFPETIYSNIEGVFYDTQDNRVGSERAVENLKKYDQIIVKPAVDSGGGQNVTLFKEAEGRLISQNNETLSPKLLSKKFKKNYIIQEVIKQHSWFEKFNSSSLNTLRVFTYRSVADESVKVLHSVMRVGKTGSITDNQASGGYACGITAQGYLTGIAVNKYGVTSRNVNNIPLTRGEKIEGYGDIILTAVKLAEEYRYARLLGLDICLDQESNVRVLEINCLNNEINFYQMLGGPLFGDYTDEIIEWCSGETRSFLIDFDI